MMRDINDQAWRADLLADVLLSFGTGATNPGSWVHVNLIPLNPVPGATPPTGGPISPETTFTRSRSEDMAEFVRRLEAKGISTTIRDTRGDEINAACGQLAATED